MPLKSKAIDEDGFRKRKPREPKRRPLDSRVEYRLSDGAGNYWSGSQAGAGYSWPESGEPVFNKVGGKWSSESRALQLWAEYNLARAVQGAAWPDLVLEKFEIVVKKAPAPTSQPMDLSKLVAWYQRFQKYTPLLSEATRLMKSGVDFKYLMEYRGDGSELPSHLKMHLHVVKTTSYGMGRTDDHYITAAFFDDKDMIFARVALGDRVKHIITDDAVSIYTAEDHEN